MVAADTYALVRFCARSDEFNRTSGAPRVVGRSALAETAQGNLDLSVGKGSRTDPNLRPEGTSGAPAAGGIQLPWPVERLPVVGPPEMETVGSGIGPVAVSMAESPPDYLVPVTQVPRRGYRRRHGHPEARSNRG